MTKTIVMIHGMFGGGWYWDNYKGFFEKRKFQCHTPTLRFHDVDPEDKPCSDLGTTSLLDYAQDLEDYIGELDERPILLGHSMGGLLAQILGARGLATGLVLLTPGPPRGIMPLKFSAIKSCLNGFTEWGFWRKPVRLSFKSTVYAMLHLLSKVDQKKTYARLVYESGQAGKETGFWLFDSKKVSKVAESKVTCPVLVVSGAKDRVAPPAMVQKIANKYKAVSKHKEFQNHAHWIMNEPGWEEVAEYIDDWIKQTNIK